MPAIPLQALTAQAGPPTSVARRIAAALALALAGALGLGLAAPAARAAERAIDKADQALAGPARCRCPAPGRDPPAGRR